MAIPSTMSAGARPYNAALLTTFALLSVAGAWFMRISVIINDAPVGFNDIVASGVHPNGVSIIKHYTGLKPVDEVISVLVSAFMSGAAGWNQALYWQQFHFLVQISAIIAVLNVEACRERNQGSWLKYTGVLAFLYQNVGGAVLIPIWMILFHRISGPNSYFQSGRTVPLPYARLILPATILIYSIPAVAIYIPGWPLDTLQYILAYWQFTPILVNIPLWFAASSVSYTPAASSKSKNADLPHLKLLYNVLFVVSLLSHWFTIYKVVSSNTPGVTLSRVFLPSPAHWLTSHEMGLLWIFQWDWIICAILHVIPAIVAICDVRRFSLENETDPSGDRLFKAICVTAALTVLGGPGAAIAGVWGWREEQLAAIEERAAIGGRKKQ